MPDDKGEPFIVIPEEGAVTVIAKDKARGLVEVEWEQMVEGEIATIRAWVKPEQLSRLM